MAENRLGPEPADELLCELRPQIVEFMFKEFVSPELYRMANLVPCLQNAGGQTNPRALSRCACESWVLGTTKGPGQHRHCPIGTLERRCHLAQRQLHIRQSQQGRREAWTTRSRRFQ